MYVPIILGTARRGRFSEKAAGFMLQESRDAGLESEIIDVRDYVLSPATDDTQQSQKVKEYSRKITGADALIIVSPEYNHGYPGELKLLLDMLYQQYSRKPVGLCGVSMGGLGGSRMVEKLRLVAAELHMVSIREAVYFSNVRELFDEKGEIRDRGYHARAATFLDELKWYAQALKKAREETKK